MHPSLFAKFAGQIQLNQKFHPSMTGKFNTGKKKVKSEYKNRGSDFTHPKSYDSEP